MNLLRTLLLATSLALGLAGEVSAQAIGGSASLSVTTSSSSVNLPASLTNYPSVIIAPAAGSTQEVFYALGGSTIVATTSSPALPGGGICVNVGPSGYVAAITASSTATVRVTQLTTCANFARGVLPSSIISGATPCTGCAPTSMLVTGSGTNPPVSAAALPMGVASATVVNPGTGYVPSTSPNTPDVVTLAGGSPTTAATLVTTATQVVSATVAAGGGSCNNGTQTVTGTTGGTGWNVAITGTGAVQAAVLFQAVVTVSGNVITAVQSISRPGIYYLNPTTITAEPVTGGGCSGAQLSVVMGAQRVAVQNPGVYPAQAAQTLAQGSSAGVGIGATFAVTFEALTSNPIQTSNYTAYFGLNAGLVNTADSNTFLGANAGLSNTYGKDVTAVGTQACAAFVGGSTPFPDTGQNTCIGSSALIKLTSGGSNTAVGQKAAENATTAANLFCGGAHSCDNLTTESQQIGIGAGTFGLVPSPLGNFNIALAFDAGQFMSGTSATYNICIGAQTCQGSVGTPFTGGNSVAIGGFAANAGTSGSGLVAIGYQADYTHSALGVAVGYQAAIVQNNANFVCVGYQACFNATAGYVVCIGSNSCDSLPAATMKAFISGSAGGGGIEAITDVYFGTGYAAAVPQAYILHGSGGLGTDIAGADLILGGGKGTGAGIGGKVHIQAALHGTTGTGLNTLADALVVDETKLVTLPAITSDATHTDATVCEDTTTHGLYLGSGTAGICLGTSSARYKNGIVDLEPGLAEIMMLRPRQYYLNEDHGDPTKLLYGFVAEEAESVLPKLVGRDDQGRPNTFDYLGVVPPLVRAVQALKADNDNLRADFDQLRRSVVR